MSTTIFSVYCVVTEDRLLDIAYFDVEQKMNSFKERLNAGNYTNYGRNFKRNGKFYFAGNRKLFQDWKYYGDKAFQWNVVETWNNNFADYIWDEQEKKEEQAFFGKYRFWRETLKATYNYLGGVYLIRNLKTNDCYIGSSQNVGNRIGQHRLMIEKNKGHSAKLRKYYAEYSVEDFEFTIIEACPDSELKEREIAWISRLNPTLNTVLYR